MFFEKRIRARGPIARCFCCFVPYSILFLNLVFADTTTVRQTPDELARILNAVRTKEPITVDGRLLESVWQRPGASGFIQREPLEGQPASEQTEVWFVYDDAALYVAARMYDSSPDQIVARLGRKDGGVESDWIYVGIDAALDRRTAYVFGVSAGGALFDGYISDDTRLTSTWDGVWDADVQRDHLGWSAEFRIPFSQLRFSEKEQYVWGVEFLREVRRKSEESLLVLHPRNDQIRVSRYTELHGIEGIKPPKRIEVLPYVTGTRKFVEPPLVHSFNVGRKDPFVVGRDMNANLGADMKIGLTGELTLDLAINPDFAQVEVDPAVVNLSAYEIRFSERRPFFIEGESILNFGRGGATSYENYNWSDPSFFYSRRIGRAPQGSVSHTGFQNTPDRTTILGAAKVSGKVSESWYLAALTALTDREHGEVDSAGVRFRDAIEPRAFYTVVRARKEMNDARQGVGVVSTFLERENKDPRLTNLVNHRALSLGIDGWTFLDENRDWVLTGWTGISRVTGTVQRMLALQQSSTHYFQRPDANHVGIDSNATSLTGWASRFWLNKEKGKWRFNAALGAIHPQFETNDVGFHGRTDYVNGHIWGGYFSYDPDDAFRTKSIAAVAFREYNFGGTKIGETYNLVLQGQLLSYWGGYAVLGLNEPALDDQRTRGGPLMKTLRSNFFHGSVYSDSREPLNGSVYTTLARGLSGSWFVSSGINFSWSPSATVRVSGGPSYFLNHNAAQHITTRTDPVASSTFGKRYIFGTLDQKQIAATLRLDWTFTPRLSFQLFLQPLISSGRYTDIKELQAPRTFSFNHYEQLPDSIFYDTSAKGYTIVPAGASKFNLDDPNFNFKSLRANAVIRWEYMPGSTLYVVWTNEKVDFEKRGEFSFNRDVKVLLRDRPDNVFAIKLTYWLSP